MPGCQDAFGRMSPNRISVRWSRQESCSPGVLCVKLQLQFVEEWRGMAGIGCGLGAGGVVKKSRPAYDCRQLNANCFSSPPRFSFDTFFDSFPHRFVFSTHIRIRIRSSLSASAFASASCLLASMDVWEKSNCFGPDQVASFVGLAASRHWHQNRHQNRQNGTDIGIGIGIFILTARVLGQNVCSWQTATKKKRKKESKGLEKVESRVSDWKSDFGRPPPILPLRIVKSLLPMIATDFFPIFCWPLLVGSLEFSW